MSKFLLAGFGLSNQSVAKALLNLQADVCLFDDNASEQNLKAAGNLGQEVFSGQDRLSDLLDWCDYVVPTPGLPDSHKLYQLLESSGSSAEVVLLSELDIFAAHNEKPYVAITGTNGKTTVSYLVESMLKQSGIAAAAVGNADPIGVPVCDALEDSETEMFVVEASSFQLRHAKAFAPSVATWLNFAPDHLDIHASLAAYEASKAKIWQNLGTDATAVLNLDDPNVVKHLPADAESVAVSTAEHSFEACFTLSGRTSPAGALLASESIADPKSAGAGAVLTAFGKPFLEVSQMPRNQPHDIFNALAAAATATAAGASLEASAIVLQRFAGLPHRLDLIATHEGICWYDDSKSTTPHSVVSALQGIQSAVLIAGGRTKGLDLTPMALMAHKLRAVVALGEASTELQKVFADAVTVIPVDSMSSAVQKAHEVARHGDVVLLSPGCSSLDMYRSYKERGADFIEKVSDLLGARP